MSWVRCGRADISKGNQQSQSGSTKQIGRYYEDLRNNGLRVNILLFSYLLFIAGFFFFRSVNAHNDVFYVLILVPYLLTIPKSTLRISLQSQIFRMLLLFLGYMMMTLLWGERGTLQDYLHVVTQLITVLAFFLVTSEFVLRHEWFPRVLFFWICSAAVFAALLFLLTSVHTLDKPYSRLNDLGVLRNAIQIGCVYGMAVLLLYFSLLKRKMFTGSWSWLICMTLVLAIFCLTQSRGPLVGLYIALLFGGLLTRDAKLLFVLCCATLFTAILLAQGNGFLHHMIVERGTSYRIEIFRYTMGLIMQGVFFGQGILMEFSYRLGNGMLIKHPHNLYLTTWLHGGLAGLLLLAAFLMRAFWQASIVFIREKDFTYLALLLYASICVFTDFNRVIGHPTPLFLFFWTPIALLSAHEFKMIYAVNESGPATEGELYGKELQGARACRRS